MQTDNYINATLHVVTFLKSAYAPHDEINEDIIKIYTAHADHDSATLIHYLEDVKNFADHCIQTIQQYDNEHPTETES